MGAPTVAQGWPVPDAAAHIGDGSIERSAYWERTLDASCAAQPSRPTRPGLAGLTSASQPCLRRYSFAECFQVSKAVTTASITLS